MNEFERPPSIAIVKAIRKDEREKMLIVVREKFIEFNNHPCPELADKYNHCCDSDYCGICVLDSVLETLRQKGKGDDKHDA